MFWIAFFGIIFSSLYFLLQKPSRIWSFDYKGNHIEIQNFAFSEKIYINGKPVPSTRKKGFLLSSALHEFEISPYEHAIVQIEAVGYHVKCTVQTGKEIIFYSEDPKIIKNNHKEIEIMDEQFRVAQELLVEICDSEDDSLIEASRLLWSTLEQTYVQTQKIQSAIKNYELLGEKDHEASKNLLVKEEKRKQKVLNMIKELHLFTIQESGNDIEIPESVKNIMNQIQVEQEIEESLKKTDKKQFLKNLREKQKDL